MVYLADSNLILVVQLFFQKAMPTHTARTRHVMKWTWITTFTLTMLFTIGMAAFAKTRPQDPQPPFPYQSVEVSYKNSKAQGVRLGGTFVIPAGQPPFPTVLLITGSGLQDRDETIFNHRPFAVIADYLARRGIASLRVDDRSVGKSTGDVENATTVDFATDVEAGIAFLKTRAEVASKGIGLIGHSEGGIIAPMVAAKPENDVAFIILLAGTGVPGDRILLEQQIAAAKANGAASQTIETQRRLMETILPMIRTSNESRDALTNRLVVTAKTIDPTVSEEEIRNRMHRLTSPWMRFFVSYDPAPTLAKVKCPVLALNGAKDVQITSQLNLTAIEQTLRQSGNQNFKTLELAGLNHLFQTARTGSPSEYEEIEETFSPTVLKLIANWIEQNLKRSW
ncbi:alpha/beta fold hydrolase [Leptolyngbya sp. ST-U4]|uniref:alpha/beta hydrolase family protein n=1 Tax=Leptolyngbya sp. ST-U4 TaxID=2933912 RepID=UPI0019CC1040|nr:alpha/beta hydrolase [Cyanobacteria bacterium FACHB-502]